jgi:hypothetical protein
MEHLERHGFLRRGIARHARLSLQLRNQSARPLAQAPSWRRHSSPPLPPGVGSRLQAPGSGLRAPGSTMYGTSRAVGTTPSSWAGLHRLWAPGRATHSGRAARPRRARWEAAVRPWAPDNVADFVAFHPQVLGFVYNSTLSLRLRRKRNTSILVTV